MARAARKPRSLSPTPEDLIEEIRLSGIQNPTLLAAFRRIERAFFITPQYETQAYQDVPIPIDHQQVTSQPSLIAKMVEALDLKPQDRVLEIGTGTGYQTAILAYLSKEVYSIERFQNLSDQARANWRAMGIHNIQAFTRDGSLGLPEFAPYSAMICSAATTEVPPPLIKQLSEKGRIVIPIRLGGRDQVCLFQKHKNKLIQKRLITWASFVPLMGAYEPLR